MEFKDFSLGDRVRFKHRDYPEAEGVIIFLDIQSEYIGIAHSEKFGLTLGGHVTPD